MRWLVRGEDALPTGLEWLAPGEADRAGSARHTKRRTEYLLRRLAAKHTVAALIGLPTDARTLTRIEIANAPSGAPRVLLDAAPADIELSLTDRAGWAVCVAADRARNATDDGVGCDLELVEPRSAAFLRDFLTETERRYVAAQPDEAARHAAANLVWSAKESALKVLRIGLGRDTRSVEVQAANAAGNTEGWASLAVRVAEAGELTGWWRRDGAFLLTVVTARPGRPPRALEDPGALAAAAPRHSWVDRPVQ